MEKFIARYKDNAGFDRSILFDKSKFNQDTATEYLNKNGIQNFFFFFEPAAPVEFGENGISFKGDIGFDITTENLIPFIASGKDIYIDSPGGNLWEGWRIHDAIKALNLAPKITALGTVASASTLVLFSTENRHMTEKSRLLIHNPWIEIAGDDEDLIRIGNELKKEKTILAQFYSEISGKSIEDILNLMKENRFINYSEAIELNFIKNSNIEFEKVDEPIIDNNNSKNQIEMKNETKDELKGIMARINNLWQKVFPKNIIIQDVNGVELDFGDSATTEEEIVPGVTATVNGTPAEGEYILNDGTKYVFEAGVLKEIVQPEPEEETEINLLKAENESLKSELEKAKESQQNSIKELNEIRNSLEKELKEVKNSFVEFQNKFSAETDDDKIPADPEQKKGFYFKRK